MKTFMTSAIILAAATGASAAGLRGLQKNKAVYEGCCPTIRLPRGCSRDYIDYAREYYQTEFPGCRFAAAVIFFDSNEQDDRRKLMLRSQDIESFGSLESLDSLEASIIFPELEMVESSDEEEQPKTFGSLDLKEFDIIDVDSPEPDDTEVEVVNEDEDAQEDGIVTLNYLW